MDTAHALLLADLIDAGVVAGDAKPHQVSATGSQLVDRFGICNQLSRHADEVGLPCGEEILARTWRNTAEAYYRQANGALQVSVDPPEVGGGDRSRRDLHPVAREGTGVGVEVVDIAGRLESCRHLQTIFGIVAEGGELVHAHPHADRNVRPDGLPDRRENLVGQTHPIFEGAAVFVASAVEEGRSERTQQTVMRDLDLYPVETGGDQVAGAGRKAVDHSPNVVVVHCLRRVMAGGLRHLRRCPHDWRRVLERGVPGMCQLTEDFRSMSMRRVGNLGQVRHDGLVPRVDEAPRHLAGRMHGHAFHDDQTDAAACPLLVIRDEIVRRHALKRAERGEMRLEDDPVAQRYAADRKRTQQMRIAGLVGCRLDRLSMRKAHASPPC